MAAGLRAKQVQQEPVSRPMSVSVRSWHCRWIALLVLVLISFIYSHELLCSHFERPPLIMSYGVNSFNVSNDTLLMFSKINPEGLTERLRIRYLLKKTEFGRISIKEAFYSEYTTSRLASKLQAQNNLRGGRKARLENAWMLPLTSHRFDVHMTKFFDLAKTWLGNSDYDPEVLQGLTEKVKRPIDQHSRYLSGQTPLDERFLEGRNRYKSCAIVGNSGILLNESYGENIDSHEMVIRLNNAEIFKYKKHVGSKTTLSFMNSNVFRTCSRRPGCWCHPYGEAVPIILYVCQAAHLMDVAMCRSVHKSPLLVTDSLLDTMCARIVKWYSLKNFVDVTRRGIQDWDLVHHGQYFHYSSGMQAIVLALGICDSVDIFGFGKSAGAKHHYHTNQQQELALHDYAAEYIFYDDLANNRTIPFLSESGISIPSVRIFH